VARVSSCKVGSHELILRLAWNHVSDLKYWSNEAAAMYGISSIPSSLLLDPEGKIIAKNLKGKDLHSKLEELLVP